MTESEIRKRAGELFREYVLKLNRPFRDSSSYMKAISKCAEIALRLSELGFDIKTTKSGRREMEGLPNGEKIAVLKSSAQMSLVPKFSEAGPLEMAIVNTKIYGDSTTPEGITLVPEEETGLNAELNPSDLAWLKDHGLRDVEEKTYPGRAWRFTEEQRHALLTALRHWNQLEVNAREMGIFVGQRDTWKRIIERAKEVWPSPDGSDRYVLCFLIECELKYLKVVRDIMKKYGGTVLNVCPSPDCSSDKHIGYIEALENWLDENLNGPKY